jgi:hypothetical protein
MVTSRHGRCWSKGFYSGRATVQAVSRRCPTQAVRVKTQDNLCRICGGQRDNGASFLRVLRFPLRHSIY